MTAVILIVGAVLAWAAGYVTRWGWDLIREDRELRAADRAWDDRIAREIGLNTWSHTNTATVPEGHRVGAYCPACEYCWVCEDLDRPALGHVPADHQELDDPGMIVKYGRGRVTETWEGVPAALSGPYDPDIDVAEPFGDPPDDDDPETLSEPQDDQPSEAELTWAYEHLVRDRDHPAYYMPENRHAMRILGWTDAVHDAELAAADWDAMLAEARR